MITFIAKNNLKKIASNNYTKPSVLVEQEPVIQQEDQQERTLALLSCTDNINDIIDYIKKEGFTVIQTKIIQYSLEQAQAFYIDHVTQNYYDKMVRWLSSGSNVCALVLEKENAVSDWRLLMGPTTYKKARKSYPNSIRALFIKDASQNATHGSDSDVSSKKEIDFIF
ncbi:nucleoside diphosphate kinase, partial [Thamnidium elegans]